MAFNWPADDLTVKEKVGVGTDTPTEKLEVKGNIKLNSGVAVGEFSSDGTLATVSHQSVPTTQVVKTYVDAQVVAVNTAINAALATKAEKGGALAQDFQANNLTVQGNLEVTGQTTFRNIEQHQGDLELGDQDTDQVRIHGVVRSTHSSGLLQINSPINVLGNVTAAQFIGDGSGLTGLTNPWSSGGNNLAYLGGNVGIGTATPYTQLTLTGSLGFSNATTPMMYIFQSGIANPDRPIIAHSPAFPNWGLMYRDPDDKMIFQNGGTPVMTVALGAQTVGIGTATPNDRLDIAGNLRILSGSNPIRFTAGWTGFPDSVTNQAEISNDTGTYKTLMIVGNKSAGLGRRVSVWDRLEVNGNCVVTGVVTAPQFLGTLVGAKVGYVVDQFINNLGETLEEGDVVVLGDNQTSLYYGDKNDVPIPEVDLTEAIYDTRACGIVSQVYAGLPTDGGEESNEASNFKTFTPEEQAELDLTKVKPGQIGIMVTLGTYAYCKVDADIAPIKIGDLLTTSPTKGHAQKVLDRPAAIGAIIAKALAPLDQGKGKIPVMVTLQ